MLLSNLLSIPGEQCVDVLIEGQKMVSVSPHVHSAAINTDESPIEFNNAIVFPGLINSHDHLDFN
ncbi:MAG TPA: hypothetical protein VKR58_06705, partial [Aquella sp.]|nr:hypothetical protein [Aquella sp.]